MLPFQVLHSLRLTLDSHADSSSQTQAVAKNLILDESAEALGEPHENDQCRGATCRTAFVLAVELYHCNNVVLFLIPADGTSTQGM
jgi:hypothetical protein